MAVCHGLDLRNFVYSAYVLSFSSAQNNFVSGCEKALLRLGLFLIPTLSSFWRADGTGSLVDNVLRAGGNTIRV